MSTAKSDVAAVAETMAAQALIDRGAPAVKARGGKARLLHIVDAEGKPTGKLATHGQVLTGAAKVAQLELEARDGRLPSLIQCSKCKAPIMRRKTINKICQECIRKGRAERSRERERLKRAGGSYDKSQKAANIKALHDQRRAAGLCRCGKAPAPGMRRCAACNDADKARRARLR